MRLFHKPSQEMLLKMRLEKALWDLANCFVERGNGPFGVKRPILWKLRVILARMLLSVGEEESVFGKDAPQGRDATVSYLTKSKQFKFKTWNNCNMPKRPPAKLKKKREKKNLLLPINREQQFPNSLCHLMGYFGKFYKLQTCKRVQRPLVFFKPIEKQVKPCVAHTPKNKKKKKREFGEKIKADFSTRWMKTVIRSWEAHFPLWLRREAAAEFNRGFFFSAVRHPAGRRHFGPTRSNYSNGNVCNRNGR